MAFGKQKNSQGIIEPRDPKERRDDDREVAFKNAQVRFSGAVLACIVRDASESGCRIAIESAETLPDDVEIRLGPTTPFRRAHIAWRDQAEAGAEFID